MRIILCDKDVELAKGYEKYIHELLLKKGHSSNIEIVDSGEKLLFELSDEAETVDVLFIDTDFGDKLDGIETVRRLQEIGLDGVTVFLTEDEGKVYESFDVHPFHYLVKGKVSVEKFNRIAGEAIDLASKKHKELISFACAGDVKTMAINDISFFENVGRIIEVHSGEEVFEFYSTMNKLENQLYGRNIIRVHKNYIVNLRHVAKVKDAELIMNTGEVIPIGRKYSSKVHGGNN